MAANFSRLKGILSSGEIEKRALVARSKTWCGDEGSINTESRLICRICPQCSVSIVPTCWCDGKEIFENVLGVFDALIPYLKSARSIALHNHPIVDESYWVVMNFRRKTYLFEMKISPMSGHSGKSNTVMQYLPLSSSIDTFKTGLLTI